MSEILVTTGMLPQEWIVAPLRPRFAVSNRGPFIAASGRR